MTCYTVLLPFKIFVYHDPQEPSRRSTSVSLIFLKRVSHDTVIALHSVGSTVTFLQPSSSCMPDFWHFFWYFSATPVDSLFHRKDWNCLHVIQRIFSPKLPLKTVKSTDSSSNDAFMDAIEGT